MTAGERGDTLGKLISELHTPVLIQLEEAGGIPVLHAAPSAGFDEPLPTIFFFHSVCMSKELIAYFGYMLVAAGS